MYCIHFIITFGKFGPPYLGETTAAARAALPSPTSACWVFSCFRNPPNSDMDYRIFNVCTRSFSWVRIHTGVELTNSDSARHFDSKKISQFCLVLLTGFEPRILGFRVRRSVSWATPSPHQNKGEIKYEGYLVWSGENNVHIFGRCPFFFFSFCVPP